ncbi:MAG: hypothetical protein AB1752_00740 [Candidatus Zixiibacteriota bacterium]
MNHRCCKRWAVVLGTVMVLVVSLTTVSMAETPFATPWLRTGVGARAAGMGNAFVAVAGDATAGFFNPAGLTRINCWGFASMLSADMSFDRSFNYLALAGNFKWGAVAGSWLNAGIDGVRDGVADPDPRLKDSYKDNYFLLSYANKASAFRWGASLVIANNAVSDATGVGADVGMQWDFHEEARFGLAAQSLGLKVDGETSPYNLRLGLALMPDVMEGFTFPVEIQKTQNVDDIKFRIGGEYMHRFDNSDYGTALRAGVDDGAFSIGAGLFFKQFGLDYAYVTEKVDFLEENHRFSLVGNF